MHWTRLFEKVNAVRLANRNTITHLLSQNPCFVSIPNKKGYWRLDVSKLSRYFVDERGKLMATDLDEPSIDLQNKAQNSGVPASYKRLVNHVKAHPSKELPELWETFSRWAFRQKGIRYEKAKTMAKSNDELVEKLFLDYSKLLCKLAQSRSSYSMDKMDLVQEGFFGLIRAMELHSEGKGVPFGHYAKRHILSKMLRKYMDIRKLVRFPVHVWEKIREFESVTNSELIRSGSWPEGNSVSQRVGSLARWKNIDYISFEQYWASLFEYQQNKCIPSWTHMEIMDDLNLKFLYEEQKTIEELRQELKKLCDVVEADCELLWDPTSIDNVILNNDLNVNFMQCFKHCQNGRD